MQDGDRPWRPLKVKRRILNLTRSAMGSQWRSFNSGHRTSTVKIMIVPMSLTMMYLLSKVEPPLTAYSPYINSFLNLSTKASLSTTASLVSNLIVSHLYCCSKHKLSMILVRFVALTFWFKTSFKFFMSDFYLSIYFLYNWINIMGYIIKART